MENTTQDQVFFKAVRAGNARQIRHLLDAGANVRVKQINYSDNTPLHVAVETGNIEVLNLLISNGADVSARNFYNETVL